MTNKRSEAPMNAFEYDHTDYFGSTSRCVESGITIREYGAIHIAATLSADRDQSHKAICEEAVSIIDKLMEELGKSND